MLHQLGRVLQELQQEFAGRFRLRPLVYADRSHVEVLPEESPMLPPPLSVRHDSVILVLAYTAAAVSITDRLETG